LSASGEKGEENNGLPQIVRHAALRFLSNIIQAVRLPQASWYQAATLLDTYHRKTLASNDLPESAINVLPATCTALMFILKKADCITAEIEGFSFHDGMFIHQACAFAKYLQSFGYPDVSAELSQESICKQEIHVLKVLGWRIQVPTIETWTNAYTSRFNLLTRSLLVPSMKWVWQQGLFGGCLVMMRQTCGAEMPQRALTAGLLGIGLVGARLLPLEALRPPEMTSEEWSELYQAIQPQKLEEGECALPTKHSQCLLELLAITVGDDLTTIQEYCRLAAFAMRAALEECRDLQMPAAAPMPIG